MKKVIAVPGWASGPEIWEPLERALGSECEFTHVPWHDAIKNGIDKKLLTGGVILAGWSLGTLAALKAAHENPGGVSGMWLFSATARMAGGRGYAGVDEKVLKAMSSKLGSHRNEVTMEFAKNCLYPDEGFEDLALKLAEKFSGYSDGQLRDGLEFLRTADLRAEAAAIKIPALIMHGKHDKIIPVSQAEKLAGDMGNSRAILLETGHGILWTHAGEVAGAAKGCIW